LILSVGTPNIERGGHTKLHCTTLTAYITSEKREFPIALYKTWRSLSNKILNLIYLIPLSNPKTLKREQKREKKLKDSNTYKHIYSFSLKPKSHA